MNPVIMAAIGELQKQRDEIQRLIRDLERVMAGMAKADVLPVVEATSTPVAKANPRSGPRKNPNKNWRTGRPKSAETDAAGLAIIQALGQAPEPLTPTEIMSATKLERWKVAQLLMKMTDKGAVEKTGYAFYQLQHQAKQAAINAPIVDERDEPNDETQSDHGVDAQVS